MPTRNSKRVSQAAQAAPGRPKRGHGEDSQVRTKLAAARENKEPHHNPTTTDTNPNNGEQQVVPQPAVREAQPAMAAPLVEPQKSQEACFLTDDDDHTRADDQNDQHAVASENGEAQQKQQKQQDDEDAAAAVAAAAALTAAAAERAGQLSEEDDEDEDPSVPKPRTGSEIGAEAMDSVIEDCREGAVWQRNKRKAAQDATAAANTVSELNNSGATITSGGNGDTNGHNRPSKRSKHDTGANSRHKRNIENKKKPSLFLNKRKDEQPSNGGGSGEGSNEPSGSQMAAMGGAAMDNGSDESGEECKSAQQPLPAEKKNDDDEWDDEDDRTEDESPRKRRRGDGTAAAVDAVAKEEENAEDAKQQQRQKDKNKTTFAQEPWVMMPPPPIRGQQQSTRNQTNAVATTANTTAPNAPTDLHKCASSLSSMHSYYTNAQHHFMSQMQDIMAVAMDHHTHAAVAALTNGTATAAAATAAAPDLLAADDIAAISRACATALGIINNIGAAPGPAAAAAAFFATGGIGNIGNNNISAAAAAEMMLPTRPLSALDSASAPVVANTTATHGGGTQLLGTMPALPLPLPLSLYLPTSASAPPHPLQRQLSNGMDLALLHATAAINGGGVNGAIDAMNQFGNFFDGGNLLGGGGVGDSHNQQFQKMLGSMVPVVGGASMIDPTSFPGGLPLAAMHMAPFPIHLQMAAAAAAAAAGQGIAVPLAQPAQAGN